MLRFQRRTPRVFWLTCKSYLNGFSILKILLDQDIWLLLMMRVDQYLRVSYNLIGFVFRMTHWTLHLSG